MEIDKNRIVVGSLILLFFLFAFFIKLDILILTLVSLALIVELFKSKFINNISDFRYWFEITGLQRHIKAIGIFSRLNYRDGKSGYLHDIPRTYAYMDKVLNKYKELSTLNEIFSNLEISNKISQ